MPTLRERLWAKLPEVVFEAISIVFAVLLALAVDQWREERSLRRQAERARQAVMTEIRSNREELRAVRANNDRWRGVIAETLIKPGVPDGMRPSMSWAMLSSGAWQTAQGSQASQYFDYEWLVEVAQLYEGQALFSTTQSQFYVESGLAFVGETRREGLQAAHDRLAYLVKLSAHVLAGYDLILAGKKFPSRAIAVPGPKVTR